MIQARELRIGNYVTYFKKEIVVIGIRKESASLHITGADSIKDLMCCKNVEDAFDGIPLSEEWLLSFGYKLVNDTPYFKSFEGEPYVYLKKDSVVEMSTGIPIHYVHELQNRVFSLTGKELLKKPKSLYDANSK